MLIKAAKHHEDKFRKTERGALKRLRSLKELFLPADHDAAERSASTSSNTSSTSATSSSSKPNPNERWSWEQLLPFLSENKDVIFELVVVSVDRVEAEVQERTVKGKKAQRSETLDELLDVYLFVLEQILLHLPDDVHNHWKLAEIDVMFGKLLNPRNHVRVLKAGIRLTTIWASILGTSMTSRCWHRFNAMVSLFEVDTWCPLPQPPATLAPRVPGVRGADAAGGVGNASAGSRETMLSPPKSPLRDYLSPSGSSPKGSPKCSPKASRKMLRQSSAAAASTGDRNLNTNHPHHPHPPHPLHPPPLYPPAASSSSLSTSTSSTFSSSSSDSDLGTSNRIVAGLVDVFLETMSNAVLAERKQQQQQQQQQTAGSGNTTTTTTASSTLPSYSTTQFFFLYESWCRFHLPTIYPNIFHPSVDAAKLLQPQPQPQEQGEEEERLARQHLHTRQGSAGSSCADVQWYEDSVMQGSSISSLSESAALSTSSSLTSSTDKFPRQGAAAGTGTPPSALPSKSTSGATASAAGGAGAGHDVDADPRAGASASAGAGDATYTDTHFVGVERVRMIMAAHVRLVIVQWFIFWFKSQSPRCRAIQAQFCWRRRDLDVVHAVFGDALQMPIEGLLDCKWWAHSADSPSVITLILDVYHGWLHLGTRAISTTASTASSTKDDADADTREAGASHNIASRLQTSLSTGRISRSEFDVIAERIAEAAEEEEGTNRPRERQGGPGPKVLSATVVCGAPDDVTLKQADSEGAGGDRAVLSPLKQYGKQGINFSQASVAADATTSTTAATAATFANVDIEAGEFAVAELIKMLAAPNGAGAACEGSDPLPIGYTSTEQQLDFYLKAAANLRWFADPRVSAVCEAPELHMFFCDTLTRAFQLYGLLIEQASALMPEPTQHSLMSQLLACVDRALLFGSEASSASVQPVVGCEVLHSNAAEAVLSVWSHAEAFNRAPTEMWTELSAVMSKYSNNQHVLNMWIDILTGFSETGCAQGRLNKAGDGAAMDGAGGGSVGAGKGEAVRAASSTSASASSFLPTLSVVVPDAYTPATTMFNETRVHYSISGTLDRAETKQRTSRLSSILGRSTSDASENKSSCTSPFEVSRLLVDIVSNQGASLSMLHVSHGASASTSLTGSSSTAPSTPGSPPILFPSFLGTSGSATSITVPGGGDGADAAVGRANSAISKCSGGGAGLPILALRLLHQHPSTECMFRLTRKMIGALGNINLMQPDCHLQCLTVLSQLYASRLQTAYTMHDSTTSKPNANAKTRTSWPITLPHYTPWLFETIQQMANDKIQCRTEAYDMLVTIMDVNCNHNQTSTRKNKQGGTSSGSSSSGRSDNRDDSFDWFTVEYFSAMLDVLRRNDWAVVNRLLSRWPIDIVFKYTGGTMLAYDLVSVVRKALAPTTSSSRFLVSDRIATLLCSLCCLPVEAGTVSNLPRPSDVDNLVADVRLSSHAGPTCAHVLGIKNGSSNAAGASSPFAALHSDGSVAAGHTLTKDVMLLDDAPRGRSGSFRNRLRRKSTHHRKKKEGSGGNNSGSIVSSGSGGIEGGAVGENPDHSDDTGGGSVPGGGGRNPSSLGADNAEANATAATTRTSLNTTGREWLWHEVPTALREVAITANAPSVCAIALRGLSVMVTTELLNAADNDMARSSTGIGPSPPGISTDGNIDTADTSITSALDTILAFMRHESTTIAKLAISLVQHFAELHAPLGRRHPHYHETIVAALCRAIWTVMPESLDAAYIAAEILLPGLLSCLREWILALAPNPQSSAYLASAVALVEEVSCGARSRQLARHFVLADADIAPGYESPPTVTPPATASAPSAATNELPPPGRPLAKCTLSELESLFTPVDLLRGSTINNHGNSKTPATDTSLPSSGNFRDLLTTSASHSPSLEIAALISKGVSKAAKVVGRSMTQHGKHVRGHRSDSHSTTHTHAHTHTHTHAHAHPHPHPPSSGSASSSRRESVVSGASGASGASSNGGLVVDSTVEKQRRKATIAARLVLGHLNYHIGAFPGPGGAASASSVLSEVPDVEGAIPTFAALSSRGIQMFAHGDEMLVSVVELEDGRTLRLVVRDLVGKHVWDFVEVADGSANGNSRHSSASPAASQSPTASTSPPLPPSPSSSPSPTDSATAGATRSDDRRPHVESSQIGDDGLPSDCRSGAGSTLAALVSFLDQESLASGVGAPLRKQTEAFHNAAAADNVNQDNDRDDIAAGTNAFVDMHGAVLGVPKSSRSAHVTRAHPPSELSDTVGGGSTESLPPTPKDTGNSLSPRATPLSDGTTPTPARNRPGSASSANYLVESPRPRARPLANVSGAVGSRPASVPIASPRVPMAALAQRFLRQLGLSSWGGVLALTPVPTTEKLARYLRQLDKDGTSRERHKVGVMYATVDQLDRECVLSAQERSGSQDFERFADELGWAVDLADHKGYTGLGTKFVKSFSGKLPYYATASLEVCFHVASRLNPATETENGAGTAPIAGRGVQPKSAVDDIKSLAERRFRHVGNDPVAIVWCEGGNTSTGGGSNGDPVLAVRSWSKKTEAWIVVRPLPSGMYRIQILWRADDEAASATAPRGSSNRKSSSSTTAASTSHMSCGPLFDGAIVDRTSLAPLVRATSVNCGRVLLDDAARRDGLESAYETRATYIAQVTAQQETAGFEKFTSSIIAGGEGNRSTARRRARELRSSGKLKPLRRSVSSECLDSPPTSLPFATLARQSRQRSMSQDFIDRIGGGEADGGSKNDEAAESPYATAL